MRGSHSGALAAATNADAAGANAASVTLVRACSERASERGRVGLCASLAGAHIGSQLTAGSLHFRRASQFQSKGASLG